jgi:predicted nuclease of predicted toxin-antitoxin system
VSRVRFLFDEDFNGHIVRSFRRQQPHADSRTVREAGLAGAEDSVVLERAAQADQRVVVSHDRRTMTAEARRRIVASLPMAGLILFRQDCPVGLATTELVLVSEATTAEEWHNVIAFLPL